MLLGVLPAGQRGKASFHADVQNDMHISGTCEFSMDNLPHQGRLQLVRIMMANDTVQMNERVSANLFFQMPVWKLLPFAEKTYCTLKEKRNHVATALLMGSMHISTVLMASEVARLGMVVQRFPADDVRKRATAPKYSGRFGRLCP